MRGSYGVFQRLVNAGLYGVFLAGLVTAAAGGLLGFTVAEGREVMAVTVLVWYANRRALEVVAHLVDLANTAAAQFADVTQMLPGCQDLSDLQRGSGEGLNAIVTALFGLVLAFVRWAHPLRRQHPGHPDAPGPPGRCLPAHPAATSPSGGGRWPGWSSPRWGSPSCWARRR